VSNLRLDDLAGLTCESIALVMPQSAALGTVGLAKLEALVAVNQKFMKAINKNHASPLTPKINELDHQRDAVFSELKRTVTTAAKSSKADIAAAGATLKDELKPFWDISTSSLLNQSAELAVLAQRHNADAAAKTAAETVGAKDLYTELFALSDSLQALYKQRAEETGAEEAPPATSYKSELVTAYDEFCSTVEITLSALPTDALQQVFNEVNDIRRKYISKVPVPLSEAHTSVAPIPAQIYTGKHLTPLPRVFFEHNGEIRELVFAQDFTVTYRNNVEVGEAKLLVHGKGKYTGTYDTTFHIARV
jgi:hypothetical protein